jgi:hypothetical protein
MLELLILVFVAWAAYNVGVSVTAWRLRDLVYKEAKARGMVTKADQELFEGQKEKQEVNVTQLIVEKVKDVLYLYERDTDNFVCQGATLEELATLAQKYKNIKYAAVLCGNEIYAFVNGTVKTEKEVRNNEN